MSVPNIDLLRGPLNPPFWGPVSSNVDWCEKNYEYTPYIAEFWNTISNIPMIVLGFYGAYTSYKLGIGLRFPLGNLTLAVVGIGSWMFHMTLLYKYQLMDELPMILGSLVYLYIMLDIDEPRTPSLADKITKKYNWLLVSALVIYGIITCVVMAAFTSSPLPMNLSYGFIVAFIIIRALLIFFAK